MLSDWVQYLIICSAFGAAICFPVLVHYCIKKWADEG